MAAIVISFSSEIIAKTTCPLHRCVCVWAVSKSTFVRQHSPNTTINIHISILMNSVLSRMFTSRIVIVPFYSISVFLVSVTDSFTESSSSYTSNTFISLRVRVCAFVSVHLERITCGGISVLCVWHVFEPM